VHYWSLCNLSDCLQYLYENLTPRSYAVAEPTQPAPEDRTEFTFIRTEQRWLWYRYPDENDPPHITFCLEFGRENEPSYTPDPENGVDEWNVQDLDAIDDLAQGMIFNIHSCTSAFVRDQSE